MPLGVDESTALCISLGKYNLMKPESSDGNTLYPSLSLLVCKRWNWHENLQMLPSTEWDDFIINGSFTTKSSDTEYLRTLKTPFDAGVMVYIAYSSLPIF